jgi:hypothetical protein
MAIPQLDAHGLLPVGIHSATLADVGASFGMQNQRRQELFDKLQVFVTFAQGFGMFTAAYVDGSFTTDKAVPGDVDVVLEISRPGLAGLLLLPGALQILDTGAIKATYEVDLHIDHPQQAGQGPPFMVQFFQTMRIAELLARRLPSSHRRGILKVDL